MTSGGAQDGVDAVAAYWAAIDGLMDNAITITIEAEVVEIDEVSGDMVASYTTTGGTQLGDSAATPLPYQTQALIQWNTGVFVSGHRLVGRSFLPGFTTDTVDTNGTPTAGTITGIEAAITAILAGVQPLAVYSRTHHVVHVVTTGTARDTYAFLSSRRD